MIKLLKMARENVLIRAVPACVEDGGTGELGIYYHDLNRSTHVIPWGDVELVIATCEACGRSGLRMEWAHVIPDGGSRHGCKCADNIIRLCYECHRFVVHGLGGWSALLKRHAHLNARYLRALDHHRSMEQGQTACSYLTKSGQLARMRARFVEPDGPFCGLREWSGSNKHTARKVADP